MSKSKSGETPLWRTLSNSSKDGKTGRQSLFKRKEHHLRLVHGHPISSVSTSITSNSVPCFYSLKRQERQLFSLYIRMSTFLMRGKTGARGFKNPRRVQKRENVHRKWPFNARSYRINLNVQFHVFHSHSFSLLALHSLSSSLPSLSSQFSNFLLVVPSYHSTSFHYITFQCLSWYLQRHINWVPASKRLSTSSSSHTSLFSQFSLFIPFPLLLQSPEGNWI